MPVAKVYVPEGILTPEQRRDIVRGIHEVIVGRRKRPADSPTYVLINEIPARDWARPAMSMRLEPDRNPSRLDHDHDRQAKP